MPLSVSVVHIIIGAEKFGKKFNKSFEKGKNLVMSFMDVIIINIFSAK